MTQEFLEKDIKIATDNLLKMARESSWNSISENCTYILSQIDVSDSSNFNEKRKRRNRNNKMKIDKSLAHIIPELEKLSDDLFDVNLYVCKSSLQKTIIEIQYLLKSSLDKGYYEKIKGNKPMFHSKIPIPPYIDSFAEKTRKFDINWELGGLRFQWNMFWFKLKSFNS